MAHRGVDTLRFGPMKPVGLVDPRTGREPYAAVQLRQDNLAGDHYSLVGFQTQLKWGEQARVLRLIPGPRAGRVRALRHGAPQHLRQRPDRPRRDVAGARASDAASSPGRCRASKGYVESAASGLLAGLNAAALATGAAAVAPPRTTAIGALAYYVSHADPGALRAVEHHVRDHGAARARAEEPGGAQGGDCRARAGRPRGLDPRRRRARAGAPRA